MKTRRLLNYKIPFGFIYGKQYCMALQSIFYSPLKKVCMPQLFFLLTVLFINSCGNLDCLEKQNEYKSGYTAGSLASFASDGSTCDKWAREMANQGINIQTSDCYCDGFDDGLNGADPKYKD